MKRYLETSIENMRDVGGYMAGERNISYGRLIRSNLPNKLSTEDVDFLKQLGIVSVIDLRTEEEYSQKPSIFENDASFKFHHCPLIVGRDVPPSPEDVPLSYLAILEDKDNILKILTIITSEDKGTLYFCNAGKDRTGVITALIMMLLGVRESDIINDYLLTKEYMQDILQNFIMQSSRNIGHIIIPKAEYMEIFLSGINAKYGSVTGYLKQIGFSEHNILKLKEKMLTNL